METIDTLGNSTVDNDDPNGVWKAFFNRRRRAVMELYMTGWIGTAYECAEKLNVSEHGTWPRISELFTSGYLDKTGERRLVPRSGRLAAVWQWTGLNPYQSMAEFKEDDAQRTFDRLVAQSEVDLRGAVFANTPTPTPSLTWDIEASHHPVNGLWTYAEKGIDNYPRARMRAVLLFMRTVDPAVMVRITDSENHLVFFEWRRGR